MKTLEGVSILLVCLTCVLVPLIIYAFLELLLTQTRLGRRFEAWLFKRLGINPDIK